MFTTLRLRRRTHTEPGALPVRPQLRDASYDAATLAFLHVHERIESLPAAAQPAAWARVTRTLASLPHPELADALELG